ncbi:FAD-linked oxidoreductase sor8 [Penicillium cataractarum]|uniref:FAD-linked oxidoreductase sor8 n=1 Tax=Penicillium cataractarum TaxID=2100454 RepID=A0A9W9SL79_9EURO|nr:FAD-linked oxidoreductase sor8 [Penicillium cataractarum]KAJ5380616.1 FAD-linked oxidoreductase sor8 [Penicillium cataractarum]
MQPLIFLLLALTLCVNAANSTNCRCFPGDPCWPSFQDWADFNTTVGGKLISTVPIGSVCHTRGDSSAYNEHACANLIADWGFPATHYTTFASPMASWFANFSCDPFMPRDSPCTITSLQRYTVNVSGVQDVRKTIQFAREHNIRLVIRNTGHDYLGKSTAPGGLALWMHHLKDTKFLDYSSDSYSGPALRLGAGVQGFEGMAAAHAQNKVILAGNCESVGIAGGYSQGGGHGQLASRFGLAADQVLEWEVVTADGQHLIASPEKYSDLFWALSGGGGGTFAVVMSVTVKPHPEVSTASANLTFSGACVSADVFWNIIRNFVVDIAPLVDTGAVAIWAVIGKTFTLTPISWPGGTAEQLQNGLASTLALLEQNKINYAYHIQQFPTFWDTYAAMNPHSNITEAQVGGRLMPRSVLESTPSSLITALRGIAELGVVVSGVSLNVSRSPVPYNAVNPAWRDAAISVVLGTGYNYTNREENVKCQSLMTDVLIPPLTAISPNSGAYLNEADWKQPDWQKTFYGSHYSALEEIKRKFDPDEMFYARTAVGSEAWTEQSDGRLCRA